MRETCRALAELGARRVVLMTFHGAPLHNLALEAGVELLRDEGVRVVAPFNVILRELLDVDAAAYVRAFDHVSDPADRKQLMDGLRLDFHAGFFETSMALYLAPESVSAVHRDLPPCPPLEPLPAVERVAQVATSLGLTQLARELGFAAHAMAWSGLRPFPGYTSWPRHASAAAGRVFAEAIIDRYVPLIADVFDGKADSPPPIMRWAASLSLGGRLGVLPVATPSELMQFVMPTAASSPPPRG
jgi:creatinine amidohydrolase